LQGLQGLQAPAQGLHGLQGLQGLHFAAAHGLQGLQGLHGLHADAQGLHWASCIDWGLGFATGNRPLWLFCPGVAVEAA